MVAYYLIDKVAMKLYLVTIGMYICIEWYLAT